MDEDQADLETADRRVEKAKESLRSRIHEIERRYEEAKHKLDLGARIARHPRAAVGIALAAGALLGLLANRRAPVDSDGRGVGNAIVTALGALAINALKNAALREGTEMAKGWWADRTERDASGDPTVEAFLEH